MNTKRMMVVGLAAIFAMTMAGEAMAYGMNGLGNGGGGMRVQSPPQRQMTPPTVRPGNGGGGMRIQSPPHRQVTPPTVRPGNGNGGGGTRVQLLSNRPVTPPTVRPHW